MQVHGVIEREQLKQVDKSSEKERKVMECEFCDRKFKYKKSFAHHMQTEHGMSDDSDVPLSAYVVKVSESKEKEEKSAADDTEQSGKLKFYEFMLTNSFNLNFFTLI